MRSLSLSCMLLFCIAALAFLLPPVSVPAAEADDGRLLKIVVLSRHGVRAPTQKHDVLAQWSRRIWPTWPVKRGELTPRGASLVTALWGNLGETFRHAGLLPREQCPRPGDVFVRADVDERTRATARALLDGLAPDCHLGYAVASDAIDPLFHPVKAGLYAFDPISAATDILSMTDGGLGHLQDDLATPLALVGRLAAPVSPELCARFSLPPDCALSDIPNAVSVASDGRSVAIAGSLAIASSMAEIFLLEYGEWPGAAAGWGQVDAATLRQVLPVHARVFDVVNRAPLVAWARGSSLLAEMGSALLGTHYDERCNKAALVVFVGHDTNIANLGALLGVNWQLDEYPVNGIPPAAALMLELWEKNGAREVRVHFVAQPPAALHAPFATATAISPADLRAHAPQAATVSAPPVVGQARFPLEEFSARIARATAGAPLAPRQLPPLNFAREVTK